MKKSICLFVALSCVSAMGHAQLFSNTNNGAMCPCNNAGGQVPQQMMSRNLLFTSPVTHISAIPKQVHTTIKEGGTAPTLVAFQRLVPTGWNVFGGVLTEALPNVLSWPGQKIWYESLGEALVQASLRADIDWNNKSITLHTQRLIPAQQPKRTAELATGLSTQTSANGMQTIAQTRSEEVNNKPINTVSSTSQVIPPQVWKIEKGQTTFRSAMTAWAKAADWSLLYEVGINLALDANVEFEGDFKKAVCAVTDSMNDALKEAKATFSIKVGFSPVVKTMRIVRADVEIDAPENCQTINAKTTL